MPAFHRAFDANQVAPNDNSPLPIGDYLSAITASEWKITKAGTGAYLELEFQVLDGPHANRKFWDRLNLQNPSQKAVEIAERTLSSICHAVGKLQPRDSEELHNIPLVAHLDIETGERGSNNRVKGYKAVAKADGPAPSVSPAPAAASVTASPPVSATAAGTSKPAWAR